MTMHAARCDAGAVRSRGGGNAMAKTKIPKPNKPYISRDTPVMASRLSQKEKTFYMGMFEAVNRKQRRQLKRLQKKS